MATGKKTGGRKKGTPNKVTATVKEAITEAFDRAGGVEYLVNLAESDPKTFCMLVGKVIPLQVDADMNATGEIVFKTVYETVGKP